MLSTAVLAVAIPLLGSVPIFGPGSRAELGTGASYEVNAGLIPVTPSTPSEPGVEQVLTLRSGLRLVTPTVALTLTYEPRYYLRLPDVREFGRPLLLHQLGLVSSFRFDPRLSLTWNARGNIGELPTSRVFQVFDAGTGTWGTSILPIVQFSSGAELSARVSQHGTTSLSVDLNHFDVFTWNPPTSETDQTPPPRSNNLAGTLTHSIRVSSRTTIGALGQLGYVARLPQAEFMTTGAQAFVTLLPSQFSSLRLAGGISYVWADGADTRLPLPTVDIGYTTQSSSGGRRVAASVQGGSRAFYDALSGSYRPQAYIAADVTGQLFEYWSLAATLNMATDVGPVVPGDRGIPTRIFAELPVSYRMTREVALRFGARFGLLGPRLAEFSTGTLQEQISGFIALDWTIGTGASDGDWMR